MTAQSVGSALQERVRGQLRRLPPARRQRWVLAGRALDELGDGPCLLLDVGCEDGLFTTDQALRRPAWRLVGVDLAAPFVAAARQEAVRRGARNVLFAVADATRPLTSRPVDVVVALECLAEIPDDAAAVARMAEALRPGGLLLLHVPLDDWRPLLPGSPERWRREVRHGYSTAAVTELLQRAGFTDIRVRGTMRGTVTLAQELRDRTKHASGRRRAPLIPLMLAAAHADIAGATWGRPRGLFIQARRC